MTDATCTAASGPLTVVLVHGAFADASNWAGVIPILQATGVAVLAPANPLRAASEHPETGRCHDGRTGGGCGHRELGSHGPQKST